MDGWLLCVVGKESCLQMNNLNLLKSKLYRSTLSLWIQFWDFCVDLVCSHITSSQAGKVGLPGKPQVLQEALVIQHGGWHAALWVTTEKSCTTAWRAPSAEGSISQMRYKVILGNSRVFSHRRQTSVLPKEYFLWVFRAFLCKCCDLGEAVFACFAHKDSGFLTCAAKGRRTSLVQPQTHVPPATSLCPLYPIGWLV